MRKTQYPSEGQGATARRESKASLERQSKLRAKMTENKEGAAAAELRDRSKPRNGLSNPAKARISAQTGTQNNISVTKKNSITTPTTKSQKSTAYGKGVDSNGLPLTKPDLNSRISRATTKKSPYESTSDRSRLNASKGQVKKPVKTSKSPAPAPEISEDAVEYEDDFEDYESDFEEDISETSKHSENGLDNVQPPTRLDQDISDSENTATEYEKSSSVVEFEILEKKVESEFQRPLALSSVPNENKPEKGASGDIVPKNAKITKTAMNETEEGTDMELSSDGSGDSINNLHSKEEYLKVKAQRLSSNELQMSYPMFQKSGENNQKTLKIDNYLSTSAKPKSFGFVFESQPATTAIEREKSAKLNRGRKLQTMIKLDSVTIDLFHMDTMEYNRYMSLFSSRSCAQVGTQTAEDSLEQECQTEDQEQLTKWTQKPPSWSTLSYSTCDANLTRQEALGVGSDELTINVDRKPEKQFNLLQNFQQYSDFVGRASDLMLSILELDKRQKIPLQKDNDTNVNSSGAIKLTRGLNILKKLEMHSLVCDGEYAACSNSKPIENENGKKHSAKNMVTLWYLREPSMPRYFLRVWSHVTILKLNPLFSLVVCGNADGSLNFWNLKDPSIHHTQYQEQTIRTPCVNSSCMGSADNHVNAIIAVEIVPDTQTHLNVVSLDKDNVLISWSCLRSKDTADENSAIYFTSWSTLHVSISKIVKLYESLPPLADTQYFSIWKEDEDLIFLLGSNMGYALKGIFENGFIDSKPKLEEFHISDDEDLKEFVMRITCMNINHYLSILAVAYEDGYCRLFDMKTRKCFLTLGCEGPPWKIIWSQKWPPVLYIGLNDHLEVWDLRFSDIKPWKSLTIKKFNDFAVSSSSQDELLMAIVGTEILILPFTNEIKPMSQQDESRLQEFLSLLYLSS